MAEHPLAELRSCLDEALASCHDAHTAQQDTVVKSLRMICDLPQYLRSESWNAVRARVIDANPLDVLPKAHYCRQTCRILKSGAIAVPKDSELGRRLMETVRALKGSFLTAIETGLTAGTSGLVYEVAAPGLGGLIALITTFDQQYALVKQQESVGSSVMCFWALDAMQQPDVVNVSVLSGDTLMWMNARIITPCRIDSSAKSTEMQSNLPWSVMKQSIYGFRDASPEEFGDICNSVTDASHRRGIVGELSIGAGNHHFCEYGICPTDDAEYGATDYLKEQVAVGSAKQAGKPFDAEAIGMLVSRTRHLTWSADVVADENGTDTAPTVRAGKDELQVDMIVRRVQEPLRGASRSYPYGDIAVLARGATHFADLADRLYRVGIPVEVQGVGACIVSREIQIALDY